MSEGETQLKTHEPEKKTNVNTLDYCPFQNKRERFFFFLNIMFDYIAKYPEAFLRPVPST